MNVVSDCFAAVHEDISETIKLCAAKARKLRKLENKSKQNNIDLEKRKEILDKYSISLKNKSKGISETRKKYILNTTRTINQINSEFQNIKNKMASLNIITKDNNNKLIKLQLEKKSYDSKLYSSQFEFENITKTESQFIDIITKNLQKSKETRNKFDKQKIEKYKIRIESMKEIETKLATKIEKHKKKILLIFEKKQYTNEVKKSLQEKIYQMKNVKNENKTKMTKSQKHNCFDDFKNIINQMENEKLKISNSISFLQNQTHRIEQNAVSIESQIKMLDSSGVLKHSKIQAAMQETDGIKNKKAIIEVQYNEKSNENIRNKEKIDYLNQNLQNIKAEKESVKKELDSTEKEYDKINVQYIEDNKILPQIIDLYNSIENEIEESKRLENKYETLDNVILQKNELCVVTETKENISDALKKLIEENKNVIEEQNQISQKIFDESSKINNASMEVSFLKRAIKNSLRLPSELISHLGAEGRFISSRAVAQRARELRSSAIYRITFLQKEINSLELDTMNRTMRNKKRSENVESGMDYALLKVLYSVAIQSVVEAAENMIYSDYALYLNDITNIVDNTLFNMI